MFMYNLQSVGAIAFEYYISGTSMQHSIADVQHQLLLSGHHLLKE